VKKPLVHNPKSSVERRRELRSNLTLAEALLWNNLKNSNLDGKKFRRQHGIGSYIADFYCPESRLIIELDGAGHYDVLGVERDAERTRFLESLGFRVIRFENCEVINQLGIVLDLIREALREKFT